MRFFKTPAVYCLLHRPDTLSNYFKRFIFFATIVKFMVVLNDLVDFIDT